MDYKSSCFNYAYKCDDGCLRMYNSMVGTRSLLKVEAKHSESVCAVLSGQLSYNYLPENIKTALIEHGYLVPTDRDENVALAIKATETVLNEKYLSLIIMPTEQCNFRCRYCYETFKKGKMSRETQNSIIEFVRKNIANYTGVSVVWFGGEPLEALDVVEYISEKVIKICQRAKKTYVSGMTTNGYNLTPEVYEKLYNLKVLSYQITLDGFKTQHDNQRMLINGGGTFDTIVDNLTQIKKMRKIGVLFMIRTNFTKAILENIDEYLTFYKKTFGNDRQFSFYIQKASDWGGTRVKSFSSELADDVYAFVLKKLKEYNICLGRSSHFSELECELNTCYAAKKGHFVIGSDGTIYMCTTQLDFPENNVGKLSEKGHMKLNENYNKWLHIYETKKECADCFNRASCLPMKCPYHNFKSDCVQCPPMGGKNLGMFIERFRDDLFFTIEEDNGQN